jgi:hypothetical protein
MEKQHLSSAHGAIWLNLNGRIGTVVNDLLNASQSPLAITCSKLNLLQSAHAVFGRLPYRPSACLQTPKDLQTK